MQRSCRKRHDSRARLHLLGGMARVMYYGPHYGDFEFGCRPIAWPGQSSDLEGTSLSLLDEMFPDERACIEHIFNLNIGRYRKCIHCNKYSKWYLLEKRRVFSAKCCRSFNVNPLSGTIFSGTRTPLRDWFLAMLLFSNARNGISSHLIQRIIGVSHASSYNICNKIRTHMALLNGRRSIGGPGQYVHIDEAQIKGIIGSSSQNRAIVFGMATNRELVSFVVPDRKASTLMPLIGEYVRPGSIIVSDSHRSYARLARNGWAHEVVNHAKFFWKNENGFSQSQIETYWGQLKRSLRSTHLRISQANLWKYVQEFNFRYNRRHRSREIFWDLISAFPVLPQRRQCSSSGKEKFGEGIAPVWPDGRRSGL